MNNNKQTNSSSPLPDEILKLKHWTNHINKRPILKPNEWNEGHTYEQVKDIYNGQYGLLVAPHTESPYLFIDIDYPDDKTINTAKGELCKDDIVKRLQEQQYELNSPEHLHDLKPLFNSLMGTELPELLDKTYCEWSPSGTGIRMILASDEKGQYPKAYKKAKTFKGQIDFHNQFITITENKLDNAPSSVLNVKLEELDNAFGFSKTTQKQFDDLADEPSEDDVIFNEPKNGKLPNISDFENIIRSIPTDQNTTLRKAWETLTGKMYEHYDFWLTIGMAIHDYSKQSKHQARCYLAFLNWSMQDVENFKSEDDVHAKWESFGQQEVSPDNQMITWRTIYKVYNAIAFDYPRPIIIQGKVTKNPLINEWVNFEYLLNHYELKLYESGGYYVTGNEEICKKYFLTNTASKTVGNLYGPISFDGLVAATTKLCQDSKWRKLTSTSTHVKTWVQSADLSLDLFTLWLDTPFDELPEEMQYRQVMHGQRVRLDTYNDNSNLDYIYQCLNAHTLPQEREKIDLYYSMLKKTLMQMIKFREPIDVEFDGNGGMLILVGAENTYKSTFFKCLLPKGLQHLRKEVNMRIKGEKAVRDFVRALGTKAIVQIDEFEDMMDHQTDGGLFKAIISGNSSSITEIYQTTETEAIRKAIIVASTNETRQQLSDNGTRRMWFIQVNTIDTKGMLKINLHKLYNDLRDEFRREMLKGYLPWLLDSEQIKTLYTFNEGFEAKTDLAMWLENIWPSVDTMPHNYLNDIGSVQTYKGPKLLTTANVANILRVNGYTASVKMPALERALLKHCGRWSGTLQSSMKIERISNTIIEQGRMKSQLLQSGKYKYNKWLMPPQEQNE